MPVNHILQSWAWGDFKHQTTGWEPVRWSYTQDGAVVALMSMGIRRAGPVCLMYAPKGPLMRYDDPALASAVLNDLEQEARRRRAIWLKIDPDVMLATGVPGEDDDTPCQTGETFTALLRQRGWQFSPDQVQFRNTILIDLTQDEDTILMNMSQNTRRKVRTAYKKDVVIRPGTVADIPLLYDLYSITGERDDFLIRPYDYYATLWQSLMEQDMAYAFIAEYKGQPIAHVVLLHYGDTCIYFNGASTSEERNRMPNYALQWEAIKWAKQQGYSTYDMWGAPVDFNDSDPLWGVYRFKRGFRGTVVRHIGAWDYIPHPALYWLYSRVVPRIRRFLRNLRT